MSNWFDLFKTGLHADTRGVKHNITDAHLELMEKKFSEMNDDAALCIGHPETNSPAYGWLKRVKKFGNKLKGMAEDVVPEFADAVNKRYFKKISISLRPDWSIRHVGFLGAMPAAVKGLLSVPVGCFAEEPGDFTIEFSEDELSFADGGFVQGKIRTLGFIMQKLRDLIIEKFGAETADKTLQQYDIDFLKEVPPLDSVPVGGGIKSFNEPIITPEKGVKEDKMEITNNPVIPGADKPSDFAEKVRSLETENTTLLTENKTLKKAQVKGEVKNFIEHLAPGKLLPKFKRGITEILVDLMEGKQEINFSETEKKSAATLLMDFVESMPVQIPTKEVGARDAGGEGDEDSKDFAEGKVDEERLELHKKARALQKREKIPYETAVRRVMKGGN